VVKGKYSLLIIIALLVVICDSETARLRRALGSFEPDVRATACKRLGELKDKNSVALLIKLLTDSVPVVRFNAALALGNIGDKSAIEPLGRTAKRESLSDVAMAMTKALADFGPPAIPVLIELLSSPLPAVRLTACQGLGRIRAHQAVDVLIRRLDDPDRLVRRAAIFALRRIGDRRGLEAITHKLAGSDRDAEADAEEALSGRGYDEQLERARQLLRSFRR